MFFQNLAQLLFWRTIGKALWMNSARCRTTVWASSFAILCACPGSLFHNFQWPLEASLRSRRRLFWPLFPDLVRPLFVVVSKPTATTLGRRFKIYCYSLGSFFQNLGRAPCVPVPKYAALALRRQWSIWAACVQSLRQR